MMFFFVFFFHILAVHPNLANVTPFNPPSYHHAHGWSQCWQKSRILTQVERILLVLEWYASTRESPWMIPFLQRAWRIKPDKNDVQVWNLEKCREVFRCINFTRHIMWLKRPAHSSTVEVDLLGNKVSHHLVNYLSRIRTSKKIMRSRVAFCNASNLP